MVTKRHISRSDRNKFSQHIECALSIIIMSIYNIACHKDKINFIGFYLFHDYFVRFIVCISNECRAERAVYGCFKIIMCNLHLSYQAFDIFYYIGCKNAVKRCAGIDKISRISRADIRHFSV